MSDTGKPLTVKQLAEQLNATAERVEANVKIIHAHLEQQKTQGRESQYTEADALRQCIAALDRLPADPDRLGGYAYSRYAGGHNPALDRILRYLAARFGVDLVEVREQLCSRAHVDEVSPDAVAAAVQSAITGGAA